MGNQVGKELGLEYGGKKGPGWNGNHPWSSSTTATTKPAKIGILAFEVAGVMSRVAHLWRSLGEKEMVSLRLEVVSSEGVRRLVSESEAVLLGLACIERVQDLTAAAMAVARLGKRCREPALRAFEHVYEDVLRQDMDAGELGFSPREMSTKMRKVDRYLAATAQLYRELETLAEMERASELSSSVTTSVSASLARKLAWQRDEVKYLQEISLWNRKYDKTVALLARIVCTAYARILAAFSFLSNKHPEYDPPASVNETQPLPPLHPTFHPTSVDTSIDATANGFIRCLNFNGPTASISPPLIVPGSYRSLSLCFGSTFELNSQDVIPAGPTAEQTGASLINNLSQSQAGSFLLPSKAASPPPLSGISQYPTNRNLRLLFDPRSRFQNPPPSTLGGSALALHYANIIIIVERMMSYPHLISEDVRDDLYQMLTTSLRASLRARLRSRKSASRKGVDDSSVERPPQEWKEAAEKILDWLAPLAHNTIRWQVEHNFELQSNPPPGVSRTNVLLLQTLYFADKKKAEVVITDVLVAVNILLAYERDLQVNSLMESGSDRDAEDCNLDYRM